MIFIKDSFKGPSANLQIQGMSHSDLMSSIPSSVAAQDLPSECGASDARTQARTRGRGWAVGSTVERPGSPRYPWYFLIPLDRIITKKKKKLQENFRVYGSWFNQYLLVGAFRFFRF